MAGSAQSYGRRRAARRSAACRRAWRGNLSPPRPRRWWRAAHAELDLRAAGHLTRDDQLVPDAPGQLPALLPGPGDQQRVPAAQVVSHPCPGATPSISAPMTQRGKGAAVSSSAVERGRLGAHLSWARTADRAARTRPARQAFLARFDRQVDPDGQLSPEERAVRAEHALKAQMARIRLVRAAKARRNRTKERSAERTTPR